MYRKRFRWQILAVLFLSFVVSIYTLSISPVYAQENPKPLVTTIDVSGTSFQDIRVPVRAENPGEKEKIFAKDGEEVLVGTVSGPNQNGRVYATP